MRRLMIALVLVAAACFFSSCSGTDEGATAEAEPEPVDEATAAAARTRGVPQEGFGQEEAPKPQVVLDELVYEWRTSPERGLHVTLEFTNPTDSYERARGYVFLTAEAAMYGTTAAVGVYPWNTRIVDGLPADYTTGTHLLYRETQTVRAFIPYDRGDGYYNRLKLLVFSEDGRLLTNRNYDLDITGEPGKSGRIRPGFDL